MQLTTRILSSLQGRIAAAQSAPAAERGGRLVPEERAEQLLKQRRTLPDELHQIDAIDL